ncbi:DsbE family thiol:disulfide interchange protein [Marinicella rhabdoformis]|uniref:DsbE family thiol:disulfide interchange protein n=1 Tax=Marinicella rhabdoformis TaxID=2580566 RepID=UPI0012AED9C2|nr:DsbE family thiol:disulfide interchange protein [Marinicella rhabdoformis]
MKKILFAVLPLSVFVTLIVLLYVNMGTHSERLPSPLVGKAVPNFKLNTLYSNKTLTPKDFEGEVWLMNVFGSWCPSCRVEHPVVTQLAESGVVKVIGFNWKDEFVDADRWLKQFGNPYDEILVDLKGDVAIDFGVYGAPENFLIDQAGVIRYKLVGNLTPEIIQNELMPLIEELK